MVTSLSSILIVFVFSIEYVLSCVPGYPELDECFQVFLERDFPVMEEYIKWQINLERLNRRRPIIIDGPELDFHCKQLKSLHRCIDDVRLQCTIINFDRMYWLSLGMLKFINALCDDPNTGLKVFLNKFTCIEKIRKRSCNEDILDPFPWRKMLRLEIEPNSKICDTLNKNRNCLLSDKSRLKLTCGAHAVDVINRTSEAWMSSWCIDYFSSCRPNTNSFILILTTFLIVLVCS